MKQEETGAESANKKARATAIARKNKTASLQPPQSSISYIALLPLSNMRKMKQIIPFVAILTVLASCESAIEAKRLKNAPPPIAGTWKLLSGTLIQKNDTTVTDYTKNQSFVKIINGDHFAFLLHDNSKGKDSAAAVFSAGGGHYTIHDSTYTEMLEYCNDRQWEGNSFTFTVVIHNDTLIQKGVEKVKDLNVDRINIEKYIRMKD